MKITIVGTASPLRGGIAHYNALLYRELSVSHDVDESLQGDTLGVREPGQRGELGACRDELVVLDREGHPVAVGGHVLSLNRLHHIASNLSTLWRST